MLHSCRNALFHCLLFNSSLNSPEFKFELNRFESISKENAKHFSLSPSLFSPAGPIPLLSFFFPFLSPQPKPQPVSCPGQNPAQTPFSSPVRASLFSAADRWAPPVGAVPDLEPGSDSSRVRPAHAPPAPPLARTPRLAAAPIYSPHRPLGPPLDPLRAATALSHKP